MNAKCQEPLPSHHLQVLGQAVVTPNSPGQTSHGRLLPTQVKCQSGDSSKIPEYGDVPTRAAPQGLCSEEDATYASITEDTQSHSSVDTRTASNPTRAASQARKTEPDTRRNMIPKYHANGRIASESLAGLTTWLVIRLTIIKVQSLTVHVARSCPAHTPPEASEVRMMWTE